MLDTSDEPLARVPEGHSRAPRITSGAGAGNQLLQRITAPCPGQVKGRLGAGSVGSIEFCGSFPWRQTLIMTYVERLGISL